MINKFEKILMDFTGIIESDKCVEFSNGSNRIMVSIGYNPWSSEVLATVYLNREMVVENVVVVSGEPINGGYCDIDIGGALYLLPESNSNRSGNRVHVDDLGGKVGLYFVTNVEV